MRGDRRARPRWLAAAGAAAGSAALLPATVSAVSAVVIYVGSELTGAALAHYHHAVPGIPDAPIPFWIWSRYLVSPFGTLGGALAYAGAILIVWWLALAVLYWRRWFLRV